MKPATDVNRDEKLNQPKHTQGEWEVRKDRDGDFYIAEKELKGFADRICTMGHYTIEN